MKPETATLVNDWANSVAAFQQITGSSAGAVGVNDVDKAIRATDGLNTKDLVTNVISIAAGGTNNKGGGGGYTGGEFPRKNRGFKAFLIGIGLNIAANIAGGLITNRITEVQDDFDNDELDRERLKESAERCSESVEDIDKVSDSFIQETLTAAIFLVDLLVLFISRNPQLLSMANAAASSAGTLINDTNTTILQHCRERDQAIDNCYAAFEEQCEKLCSKELPKPAPEVMPPPRLQPPAATGKINEPCPDVVAPDCVDKPDKEKPTDPQPQPASAHQVPAERSVETQNLEPCPEVDPEVQPASIRPEPIEDQAEPDDCIDEVQPKVPEKESVVEPAEPSGDRETDGCENETPTEPKSPEECDDEQPLVVEPQDTPEVGAKVETEKDTAKLEDTCSGVLGALSVGIAVIGVGLLIDMAMDCLLENMETDVPEGGTPESKPEPELKPEPKPEPKPAPEPKVYEPPKDLSQVEEPTPPPKKLMNIEPANAAVEASTEPPSAPEEAVKTEQDDVKESSKRARKAGQW